MEILKRGKNETVCGSGGISSVCLNDTLSLAFTKSGHSILCCWCESLLRWLLFLSTESWNRREAVIRYCVSSVDDRLAEREKELRNATSSDMRDFERLNAERKERELRDDLYSEQTKVSRTAELSRLPPPYADFMLMASSVVLAHKAPTTAQ